MKSVSVESLGKGALGVALWIVLALLTGCVAPMVMPDHIQTWYEQPSGAYDINGAKMFYGVGKADPLQNRTLQRVNADNYARLEMARLLEKYTNALAHEALPADAGAPNPSEALPPELKGLVNDAMQRAIIIDHWSDSQQGSLFALCQLNLEDFKAVLNAQQGLDTCTRALMQADLERVYTQLSQDLFKNQQQMH